MKDGRETVIHSGETVIHSGGEGGLSSAGSSDFGGGGGDGFVLLFNWFIFAYIVKRRYREKDVFWNSRGRRTRCWCAPGGWECDPQT